MEAWEALAWLLFVGTILLVAAIWILVVALKRTSNLE